MYKKKKSRKLSRETAYYQERKYTDAKDEVVLISYNVRGLNSQGKQEALGPGPGKSAQCQEFPYNGYSPGCSQPLLHSGRISACSCTDTAPDALSIGCSQVGQARGKEVPGTMKTPITLMLAGSPHTSCLTPEGSKVGRPHGNMEGSASHSELLKAIL